MAGLFSRHFALAGSLYGADPIIGTWKPNVAKSKLQPAYPALPNRVAPKEGAEIYQTYQELNNSQITYGKYPRPQQGGVVIFADFPDWPSPQDGNSYKAWFSRFM